MIDASLKLKEKLPMQSSRRNFIKIGGTLIGSAFLTQSSISSLLSQSEKHYKAAIIGRTGKGDYGHGLELVFKNLDVVTVAAIADENPDGLKKASERSGAQRQYPDYREMLVKEKPDIVSIAPRQPDCHKDMALAVVEIGASIYMEKPITEFPEEADAIIAAAEKKGVKIAIAHTRRMSPEFIQLKELLQKGVIGNVREFRAHGKEDARVGGEDLIVLGCHDLDMMRFFFGDPLWCSGSVTQDGRDITPADVHRGNEPYLIAGDTVQAQFAFKNNIQCFWSSIKTKNHDNSSVVKGKDGSPKGEKWGFDIFGSKGIVSYRSGGGIFISRSRFLVPVDEGVNWEKLPLPDQSELPNHLRHPIVNLIYAMETNTQPHCSGYDGRWAIEMVNGIYQSQITKQRIQFPLINRKHPLVDIK